LYFSFKLGLNQLNLLSYISAYLKIKVMKTDTSEYWAMYYHVYLFFKNGGTLHSAMKKFHRMDVVKYFYNYSKVGM